MVTLMKDGARAFTAALGMLVAGLLVAPAVPARTGQEQHAPAAAEFDQKGGDNVGPSEVNMLQQALEKGGAFALIAVILFFYRRDWKTAVEFWKDQNAVLTKLVVETTAANASLAAAMREMTVVVHQTKDVMRRYLPPDPQDSTSRRGL